MIADDRRDSIDALLVKTLASCDNNTQNTTTEDSSDMLFCKSLVPILEKLPRKKNRKARVQMQQLLVELESDSD